MRKRLFLVGFCLCLTLLAACSSGAPEATLPAAEEETDGVSAALISAASDLISQGDYTAAQAVLDQLEEGALGPDALQALGLLRGTLDARLTETDRPQDTPVSVTTSPPLESLEPSLSPESEPDLLGRRQQDVNVFLTTFVESDLDSFQNGTLDWGDLIEFSLSYLQRHQADALTEQEGRRTVPADRVEEVISRFFGLETRHGSGDGYDYREGRYEFDPEPGRDACLAIATSAVALGGGQYAVTFDRYAGEPGEDLSAYYGFTSQQAAGSPLRYQDSGEAILQAVTLDGRETFQLLEYQLAD